MFLKVHSLYDGSWSLYRIEDEHVSIHFADVGRFAIRRGEAVENFADPHISMLYDHKTKAEYSRGEGVTELCAGYPTEEGHELPVHVVEWSSRTVAFEHGYLMADNGKTIETFHRDAPVHIEA